VGLVLPFGNIGHNIVVAADFMALIHGKTIDKTRQFQDTPLLEASIFFKEFPRRKKKLLRRPLPGNELPFLIRNEQISRSTD